MASSSQSGSKEGQLMHSVGDVINGEFEIKGVCECEDGRASYVCKRLSNGAEFFVQCLSLSNMVPPDRPDVFHESKNAGESTASPICDSFELNILGDTRFYVVRASTSLHRLCSVRPSQELPPTHENVQRSFFQEGEFNPRLRPCPEGRLCVVYRRGDCHLEVDVPALGLKGWMLLYLVLIDGLLLSPSIIFTIVGSRGQTAVWLLTVAASVIIALIVDCLILSNALTHSNLVITPTHYRKTAVLEILPRFRDSVDHETNAEVEPTPLDTILCQRFQGRTADLNEAKIKISSDSEGNETKSLMLLKNSGTVHVLRLGLSTDQETWLVSEINEVLENIRGRVEIV